MGHSNLLTHDREPVPADPERGAAEAESVQLSLTNRETSPSLRVVLPGMVLSRL